MCLHPRHAPSPCCCPPGPPRHAPGGTMTIEFIGIAATHPHSETEVAPDYADPVRIAHSSASPDGFTVADQVLARTQRLGVLLPHRPGFVAPTYAARKFATLDAFH